MFELPRVARLRRTDGSEVLADYVPLTPDLARVGIARDWWHWRGASPRQLLADDDSSWEWEQFATRFQAHDYFEVVAARTPDGRIQGAMLYAVDNFGAGVTDCDSNLEPGKKAVYVELLATAPWKPGTAAARKTGDMTTRVQGLQDHHPPEDSPLAGSRETVERLLSIPDRLPERFRTTQWGSGLPGC